jgi:hypothetical protein
MRSLRHPATLIAIVALVVALTGSAYASGLISGKSIRNGTITGAKLANHTITGAKLGNGAVVPANLSAVVRGGLNYFQLVRTTGTVGAGATAAVEAHCPSFAVPISGGYSIPNATGTTVQIDDLELAGNGWMAQVVNSGGSAIQVTVDAICAFGP